MCYGRNAQGGAIATGNWHEALFFTLIFLCASVQQKQRLFMMSCLRKIVVILTRPVAASIFHTHLAQGQDVI